MVPLADVVVVLVCGVPVLMSCVSCIDGLGVCLDYLWVCHALGCCLVNSTCMCYLLILSLLKFVRVASVFAMNHIVVFVHVELLLLG